MRIGLGSVMRTTADDQADIVYPTDTGREKRCAEKAVYEPNRRIQNVEIKMCKYY